MIDIRALEGWYHKHHRDLPFRQTNDPYHIWVSEIMLQQTQVETVLPFFERFIKTYPDIKTLAEADEESLQRHVEGLGYYRRFRHMHQAAKIIMAGHDGVFPDQYEHVRKLPGIGRYTAGAIMSIAFGKPYSAVDGNVIRVLSRVLLDEADMRKPAHVKRLDATNQACIEKADPAIYTQALMELGALICRPRQPRCDICPLQQHCLARQAGQQETLPYLSKKEPQTVHAYITLVLVHPEGYIMRKRSEELLRGMYEWPQYEAESIQSVRDHLSELDIHIDIISKPSPYRHVFTHRIWEMTVYQARWLSGMHPEWQIIPAKRLHDVPMAVAHRKINK